MLCVWGVALDPKKVHKNIKKFIYLLVIYSIYKLLLSSEVDLELLWGAALDPKVWNGHSM